MNRVNKYFRLAKQVAKKGGKRRRFRLGAVGIRSDGAVVTACNISTRSPERHAHAEARVVRKLDYGSLVYVVRILRNGQLANARPCQACQMAMRQRSISCYYSISDCEWGKLCLIK